MIRERLVCIVFLLLSLCGLSAQEQQAIPLKTVLEQISAKHNVSFSYIEDEIVVYKLVPPSDELTLPQKLSYVESETKLRFKSGGGKYYTIFNDKQLDKPLCGYLFDAETGQPIENAAITISGTGVATSSDPKGYFELPKISPNTITIRHMSYAAAEVSPEMLYVENCPKIKMNPIIQQLSEVVTNWFLTTGISKTAGGSYKVRPANFGILPGFTEPDVLQTMQQLPGIFSEDESISNISVRGGTHDQNLFLWNGIRMFQTGHFFGQISAFNPSLTQSVVITKNGTPAFFGESVSSVVDISSHSERFTETRSSIAANMISVEFSSKIRLSESAGIAVSARRSITNLVDTPTYVNYRERIFQHTVITDTNTGEVVNNLTDEDFSFYDFSAQYQQKIGNRHAFSIDAIGMRNSLEIIQQSADERLDSDLSQQSYGATADWKTNWNNRQASRFHIFSSRYALDSQNEPGIGNQVLKQENNVTDIGADIRHSIVISEKTTADFGYQYDETGVGNSDEINSPAFSRQSKEVIRSHSVIGEGSFHTTNKNTLVKVGIRTNYYEKFNRILVEPRIRINHVLTKTLQFELLGELKSQSISQIVDLQQDFLGIAKRRWMLANGENIPLQQSSQFSAGITFKDNGWLVSVDNFYKEVTGITTSGQNFQNQLEFVKAAGDYRVIGSEILVQKNFGKFYSWLSYSFNDNNYTFASVEPSTFPSNFELAHVVSCAGIYEWRNVKIALGSRWHSGRPVTTPESVTAGDDPQISYNSPNNTRLPEFFQVDFSASKQWQLGPKTSLQAGVSLINVLNRKNVIGRFYRISDSGSVERVDTYALERTPNANLKLVF
jgi:hypothetical protein